MIRGVLLDVDGTLVLTNDAHANAWVRAFGKFGYDVEYDKVRSLLGMGSDQLLPRMVPGLSKEKEPGKQIAQRREEIFLNEYVPTIQAAPGSRELVQRIKDEGLKIVVASSAKGEELEPLLKIANVEDLIEIETNSDEADNSKPSPDIVQVAMRKSGLSAKEVTMLGDSPYDIESAGKADVGVIAVRCGGFSDDTFKGALAIYDDPADLLRHYDESPLATMARS